jgi:hypothetical protein
MMPRPFLLATLFGFAATAAQAGEEVVRDLDAYLGKPNRMYNAEAIVPPQCYTRHEAAHNPCYTCHQSYPETDRPNYMQDQVLQSEYAFSDVGETNHWKNLFVDRSKAVAEITDAEILTYIAQDNYSGLADRLRAQGYEGYIPTLRDLHKGADAFDNQGFAKDGSGWVAFNYKPQPSTFWPTNGATDDVMIRLPARFRRTASGEASRDVYMANLAIAEAAIKDTARIDLPAVNETTIGRDLNGDGTRSIVSELKRPTTYVGGAADVAVTPMLYPKGTEFLHSVRYIGIDGEDIHNARRMKELRYMRKIRAHGKPQLRSLYGNEHQEKAEGNLPRYVQTQGGLENGMGWIVSGFIEDAQGVLRPQTHEETKFCMGCHGSIGATLDQTFAFPRKVTGAEGWGYIDTRGMADVPNVGESNGEILTYLRRVGGGDEFRENPEMKRKWFNDDGSVKVEKVRNADVHELITPSRERALALNKAYRVIVREQSYIYGRDATVTPAENVYNTVDPAEAPTLPPEKVFSWDIRLDWSARE